MTVIDSSWFALAVRLNHLPKKDRIAVLMVLVIAPMYKLVSPAPLSRCPKNTFEGGAAEGGACRAGRRSRPVTGDHQLNLQLVLFSCCFSMFKAKLKLTS